MANDVELGRLVTYLVGDSTGLDRMLKQAQSTFTGAAAQFEAGARRIEGTGGTSFKAFAAGAQQALSQVSSQVGQATARVGEFGSALQGYASTALKGLASLGIATGLWSAFGKFEDAQKGMLRLSAAIEAGGHSAEVVSKDYLAFASSVAKVTTFGKGVTLGLLQQAESYGVSGQAAKLAVKEALALAEAHGGEASSLIRLTASLAGSGIEGEAHAEVLKKMIPALRGITDPALQAAVAHRELAKMWGVAEASGQLLTARITRAQAVFGAFAKEIGATINVGLGPLVTGLAKAAEWFAAMPSWLKSAVASLAALAAGFLALVPVVVAVKAAVVAFGVAMAANPITLVIGGIALAAVFYYNLAKAITNVTGDVDRLNATLAENAKLEARIAGLGKGRMDAVFTQAAGIESRGERRGFLEEQLKAAQKQVDDYKGSVGSMQAELDRSTDWAKPSGALTSIGRWAGSFIPGLKDALAAENAPLEDLNKHLDTTRQYVEKLKAEIEKTADTAAFKKLRDDVGALEKKLGEGIKTVGMSPEQADIFKLRERAVKEQGMSPKDADAMLAEVRVLAQIKKYDELLAKAAEETKGLTQDWWAQAATLGLTSREADIYRKQIAGVSQAHLEAARQANAFLTAMEYQEDMFKRGEALTKEFQSPLDKLADTKTDLEDMFLAGAIGADVYAKALQKAEEEARGLTVAQRDAVLAGSAEALARQQEYIDKIAPLTGGVNFPSAITPGGGAAAMVPVVGAAGGVVTAPKSKSEDLLARAVELLSVIAKKPGVEFTEADLDV